MKVSGESMTSFMSYDVLGDVPLDDGSLLKRGTRDCADAAGVHWFLLVQ